jgi:hypothetical protein
MDHVENTVSIVRIQQYLDRCIETGVCFSAYYKVKAVLVVLFEVSVEQRVYTPQYSTGTLMVHAGKLCCIFYIYAGHYLAFKHLAQSAGVKVLLLEVNTIVSVSFAMA